MKISKLKKVYFYEIESKLKNDYGLENIDPKVIEFLKDITKNGFYTNRPRSKTKKAKWTFLPFIICIIMVSIVGAFKWLLTGNGVFDNECFVIKKLIEWDKYCNFNII